MAHHQFPHVEVSLGKRIWGFALSRLVLHLLQYKMHLGERVFHILNALTQLDRSLRAAGLVARYASPASGPLPLHDLGASRYSRRRGGSLGHSRCYRQNHDGSGRMSKPHLSLLREIDLQLYSSPLARSSRPARGSEWQNHHAILERSKREGENHFTAIQPIDNSPARSLI